MEQPAVTIATITLAKNAAEERFIIKALKMVKGHPLITADGGSRPGFIDSLHKMGAQIICPKEKGLVSQVRASLRAALDASDAPFILYTEPDKIPFFESQLEVFLGKAQKVKGAAVILAARNARGMKTFPAGQQKLESLMNESTELVLGQATDYCYGPMLLTRPAAKLALEAPSNLGWGWRFWLLGRLARKKMKFGSVELSVGCPKEQQKENTRGDRVYRVKQLRQNLDGLFLGLEGH